MYNVRNRIRASTGVALTSSIQVTTIQRKGRGSASRARASGTARIRLATSRYGPDLERDEQALEDEPPYPDVAERPPAALRQDTGRNEHEHEGDERGQPEIEAQSGGCAAHARDGAHRANARRRSSRPSTNASVRVSDQ